MFLKRAIMLCLVASWAADATAAVDAAYQQSLIERVRQLFPSPATTQPDSDNSATTVKCGTPLILEVWHAWPDLNEETRRILGAAIQLERPELNEIYDTPDGLFRLHYSRTGADSVDMTDGVGAGNVPIYVLNCADLLTDVVDVEIDQLGFRYPVSDSVGAPGEDPRFDIYFIDYNLGLYGLTVPDNIVKMGDEESFWATSHMRIHSQFRDIPPYRNNPYDAMAVTLAHEFHHSSQWTYDVGEAEVRGASSYPWFLEASAVAMEDFVFDDVNDYYAYLTSFYDNPWMSLRVFANSPTAEGFHPYASAVFFIMLAQRYDQVMLREMWEECGDVSEFNTFDAIRTVMGTRGTTFEVEWAEFLIWNYFTGGRNRAWAYQEGQSYPEVPQNLLAQYDTYPMADTSSLIGAPRSVDELAGQYFIFRPPPTDTSITFRTLVTPRSAFDEWMVVTAGINGISKPMITYTQDISAPIEIPHWDTYDEILMVVSPFKADPQEDALTRRLDYIVAVADTFETISPRSAVWKVIPNPFPIATGSAEKIRIYVDRASAVEVSMDIFTIDGRLVRGGEKDGMHVPANTGRVSLEWDATNRDNELVASGVYLALVRIGDKREVVKLAVRNESD